MKSWHEFITMGGYAAYVWPSYGITAAVMIWNAWSPGHKLRKMLDDLKRRHREEEKS